MQMNESHSKVEQKQMTHSVFSWEHFGPLGLPKSRPKSVSTGTLLFKMPVLHLRGALSETLSGLFEASWVLMGAVWTPLETPRAPLGGQMEPGSVSTSTLLLKVPVLDLLGPLLEGL